MAPNLRLQAPSFVLPTNMMNANARKQFQGPKMSTLRGPGGSSKQIKRTKKGRPRENGDNHKKLLKSHKYYAS